MLRDIAPFLIPLMALAIPIVALLVRHQQRMAELMYQNGHREVQPSDDVMALRREVAELKQMLHEQMIANDRMQSLANTMSTPPPIPESESRLHQR